MLSFIKKTIVLVCILGAFPLEMFAQSLSVAKNPPFPKDGERVTITIESFLFDLSNAVVTWKRGDETLLQGVGAKTFTLPSAENQTLVVEATHRETGQTLTQGISIITSEVDMLWEAIGSYTPPFYKGKALPALEANINVVAIPKRSDIGNLFYSWEKEYSSQSAQSGRGKNSFAYLATPLEQANTVSVGVKSSDGSYESREDLTIRYGNSEVVFYEEDSVLGTLYNRAVKDGFSVGSDKEIALSAIPYFVTVDAIESDTLDMVWSINGSRAGDQVKKNKIRLSGIATGISGPATISVIIKNTARLFEEGTVGVSLEF
jgi:hypothetical protein